VTPTVILNAVDTERFTPSPPRGERLDELAGFSPSHQPILRVGLVATYALWKGQRLFLEAASEFISTHPDALVRFYIVGGSIYYTQAQWSRGELEQIATSLGIRDRVGFVPFQLDTVAIYRDLDIMVHASTQPEPFGLTIAEAMSCGRAVIVANAGGASEIFSDGIDALGFTPGDRSSLVQCLSRLISDSALRTRLGQAARQSAERRFNLSRYFAECEAYFAAIIRQLRKMRRIESIEREG
jgi:glycosyltransferase involved in cell wall biosynthesis